MIQLDNASLRIGVCDKISLERMRSPENIGVIQDAAREVLGAARKVFVELVDGDGPGVESPASSPAPLESIKLPEAVGPEMEAAAVPRIVEEAAEIFGGTILRK